jgi:hypothetical protein
LKCANIDAHMMALESLIQLTKTRKCRSFAAHCVLCGDFLPTLLALIQSCKANEMEHSTVIHRNALTVLANCLTSLEESGELVQCIQKQDCIISKQLMMALLDDLSTARRCLQPLLTVHRQLLNTHNVSTLLEEAQEFGRNRHAELESECRKLVDMHF